MNRSCTLCSAVSFEHTAHYDIAGSFSLATCFPIERFRLCSCACHAPPSSKKNSIVFSPPAPCASANHPQTKESSIASNNGDPQVPISPPVNSVFISPFALPPISSTLRGNLQYLPFSVLGDAPHNKCPFYVGVDAPLSQTGFTPPTSFVNTFVVPATFRSDRVVCGANCHCWFREVRRRPYLKTAFRPHRVRIRRCHRLPIRQSVWRPAVRGLRFIPRFFFHAYCLLLQVIHNTPVFGFDAIDTNLCPLGAFRLSYDLFALLL